MAFNTVRANEITKSMGVGRTQVPAEKEPDHLVVAIRNLYRGNSSRKVEQTLDCTSTGKGEEKLEGVSADNCLKGFAGKEREMEQLKELMGSGFFSWKK